MKTAPKSAATPTDSTERAVAPWILRLFAEGAPLGFQAGDSNLYRYVMNSPTNATDPSGLAQEDLDLLPIARPGEQPGSWEFWASVPRRELNISGSGERSAVTRAIRLLDDVFTLDSIPWVDARIASPSIGITGRLAPAYFRVTEDQSVLTRASEVRGTTSMAPLLTPAQLARINLRVNLLQIKQDLVTQLYALGMRYVHPGTRRPDAVALERAANQTADDLIRMVDRFLRTHPGARPALGTRSRFGVELGDRFSHPWCADWAEAMEDWIRRQIRTNQAHPANRYWQFDWGQCRNGERGQHNFIIVYPLGYAVQMSVPGRSEVDPVILLFDPWRELTPRLYAPIPLTGHNGAPTQRYIPDNLEDSYYRDHEIMPGEGQ